MNKRFFQNSEKAPLFAKSLDKPLDKKLGVWCCEFERCFFVIASQLVSNISTNFIYLFLFIVLFIINESTYGLAYYFIRKRIEVTFFIKGNLIIQNFMHNR